MTCCPNCGLQLDPQPACIGDLPVEKLVEQQDEVRNYQMARPDSPHSINVALKDLHNDPC